MQLPVHLVVAPEQQTLPLQALFHRYSFRTQ
jgi:hypothetical protein